MKITICDDCESDALTVRSILDDAAQNLNIDIEVDLFLNPCELIDKISEKNYVPDILALDIDMPDISGMELARQLRSDKINTIIIFISSHDEFVFDTFKLNAFRYIRKMKLKTDLADAFEDAVRVLELNKDYPVFFNTDNGEMKIMTSQIMYYEADARKTALYLNDGKKIILKKKISDMQKILTQKQFIMIHRSCIINSDYVKNIENCIVELDNCQKLIVSRTRFHDVRKQILKLWSEKI